MIILFDLDSTLVTLEGCDRVADKKGIGEQIAAITKATMDGTMDFDQAFVRKTLKIAPSMDDIRDLGLAYVQCFTPGMLQLVQDLQSEGHIVAILTQGYREAALIVADVLKIDPERVFGLVFDYTVDGNFAGFPDQILEYENGKKRIVENIKQQYSDKKVMVIGDSVSDVHAGEAADVFIGFGGVVVREKVQVCAQYFANSAKELETMVFSLVNCSVIP